VQNLRVELTNWAHALVTWIAAIVAAAGGGATVATFLGSHIQELPSLLGNGTAAFIIGLASKFIDSANNAYTTPKPQPPAPIIATSTFPTVAAAAVPAAPPFVPPVPAPPPPPAPPVAPAAETTAFVPTAGALG